MIKTIKDVKVGDFVKYSDKVKKKKFSYVGEVTHIDKSRETFEMMTHYGDMGFCLAKVEEKETFDTEYNKEETKTKNNQELEVVTKKPKGWAKFKKDPENWVKENLYDTTPVKIKSKKQKVFDLVKNNPRKKLKGLLTLAKKEIGGSEGKLKIQIQLAITKFRK